MNAIEVHALRKAYGETIAVDGIDVEVSAGEVFALLGPNGAGKTTTVEILEGYRRRDSGTVRVLGADPQSADRAWRARIGVVLQSTGEFDALTVAEVVHHFAGYYPAAANPDEIIERVGLTDKRAARTHSLSGGQKRRLDVALGIIGQPELLFLDEPTTGFDPQARRDFWRLIRSLAEAGTTILLTTHYLAEAEALADRVGVLAAGTLVAVAAPADLGNRGTAPATVRWLTPDGPRESVTTEPTALIQRLVKEHDGEIPGLTVTRPTLEDVYLHMIGS